MCMPTEVTVDGLPKKRFTLKKDGKKKSKTNTNSTPDKKTKKNKSQSKNNNNNNKPKSKNGKKKNGKRSRVAPMPQNDVMTEQECSQYIALDCEMVGVGPEGLLSALARVCIVDWNHNVLYDTHVKVYEPVTDYRTFVSGIRAEDIESDEAVDFDECRATVKQIMKGKILVGHALRNDLNALEIYDHPWYDIRDTAKYEPFMKRVSKECTLLRPRKLKDLALTKLKRVIQRDGEEHCPKEDAIAALDLYKKARGKWEKAMEYKVGRTREIKSGSESDSSSAC